MASKNTRYERRRAQIAEMKQFGRVTHCRLNRVRTYEQFCEWLTSFDQPTVQVWTHLDQVERLGALIAGKPLPCGLQFKVGDYLITAQEPLD